MSNILETRLTFHLQLLCKIFLNWSIWYMYLKYIEVNEESRVADKENL